MHLHGILETVLYGTNLNELADFYKNVFGFNEIARTAGRNVVLSCNTSALILFNPEASIKKEGKFPYRGTVGPGHVAFLIKNEELGKWQEHLKNHKINIEKEISWEEGGTSIYFRDPADNSVELAPATLWNNLGEKLLSIE
jgi:catechol-2,3-dioxygenase